ncbi:hypothetical protein P22_0852 [Propionispora sp. 2/2-37]|uniref:tetratricopeptide repeat protein n=1 Tax=Propionispora sp. 2/2-37 TaxID=1677858 RepID=UPI0006BB6E0A|nr:DUF5107 domain-containing protein [Propionispora sp. 2/2-37]CUH94786.1 hypothetical protein P22_0852 [Propionispora sp. 2/2-37]
MQEDYNVAIWEEWVDIPTYPVGKPDKNPMFLEKRVYQGSSGKVYPYPVIDKIYDDITNKKYKAVFLENQYLQIMVLPELGGRIQRALDKTNHYDFVYYNHVIKPALVGLAGPWISGGIEFNWPQHHRPNTFGPVEYEIRENNDGSKTLWVSEIDRIYGTKGMAGFTLYPGKAFLEITGQLYNRTAQPQTFLWWANPAVAVNDHTQSVFPPDVHAVFDHGKRDVSKFPVATGVYYKMDYSAGVDISWYKNIPVPTSYMAQHSDYDFIGGYDHSVKAGILHVANHHISPGKKQWTWGCGDFGKAWDRNLTDADGPYVELMTGMFTDNQPDFSWLQPNEEKTFKQYFMPYKDIGVVKNANIRAAVSLEVKKGKAYVGVYATACYPDTLIELAGEKIYLSCRTDLSPEQAYTAVVKLAGEEKADLRLRVTASDATELIVYRPERESLQPPPAPARAIPADPKELPTNEALYLAGLHLEQYRHATYEPDRYYLEGLSRDPEDLRINNAYGVLLLRRGWFVESEKYFRAAVKTATRHNPNPYDGEPYYNLGLSLQYQGKYKEAYAAFYKSVWNAAWQDSGYYALAQLDCINRDYQAALEHLERSLVRNYHNCRARLLKTAVLRNLNRREAAEKLARETTDIDPLDFGTYHERYLLAAGAGDEARAAAMDEKLTAIMRDGEHNYLALAADYAAAGFFEEAVQVLEWFLRKGSAESKMHPMIYYYLGYYHAQLKSPQAEHFYKLAEEARPDYCFPNRLEDIAVLQAAGRALPAPAKAAYYLGNLWYDKKQSAQAIACWEESAKIDPSFATVHRNLALAYYNKRHDAGRAQKALEKAFALNSGDARVFLELDQLYKKINKPWQERLTLYQEHQELIKQRDDLYIEYVTLINLSGDFAKAQQLLAARQFHPWEGGEGKVTRQYVYSHVETAKHKIRRQEFAEAVTSLEQALAYTENLGEGKLAGAQENDIYYYLGLAYRAMGDAARADACFQQASQGLDEPASAMFYNDQPPETVFYQGLSLLALGNNNQARGRFNKLINYGEAHLYDNVAIDYFAVSLPDFLIFDEDLTKKNQIHCHYLLGLGYLGLEQEDMAKKHLTLAQTMDVSHQGVHTHLKMVEEQASLLAK